MYVIFSESRKAYFVTINRPLGVASWGDLDRAKTFKTERQATRWLLRHVDMGYGINQSDVTLTQI